MKSYRKELCFNLPYRRGFLNITHEVEAALKESGIREGLVLCNAMHITASTTTNRGFTPTSSGGWSASRRRSPTISMPTTGMRTMPTRT